MKKLKIIKIGLSCLAALLVTFAAQQKLGESFWERSTETQTVSTLSELFVLDKLYQSMLGPWSLSQGPLNSKKTGETYWLKGMKSEVIVESGDAQFSNDFFCHVNLTKSEPYSQNKKLTPSGFIEDRGWFFVLVPGHQEISLPEGFAIPLRSEQSLDLLSMSLNQTAPEGGIRSRIKTTVSYLKEQELEKEPKPLFFSYASISVPFDTANDKETIELQSRHTGAEHHGASCVPQLDDDKPLVKKASTVDVLKGNRTAHWFVPPGRHTYRSEITEELHLPFDTTAHYVTGHLHPHGEYLELKDLTENRVVLSIKSKDHEDRTVVAKMDDISSKEGIKLFKGHRYELSATYNNKTEENVDAMGMLYIYLLNRKEA